MRPPSHHALTLVLLAAIFVACGGRTALHDELGDGAIPDAGPPPVVRCPPDGTATCAPGETCCASPGCPVQYACTSASVCPALDFNGGRTGLGCDEQADCPGAQCCAVPYTAITAAGMCTAWATGVPAGRFCRDEGDCAGLGRHCCACGRSPVRVCLADCNAPACVNAL